MDDKKISILFTGQGAQKPGMCMDLYYSENYRDFKETVDSASEYLKMNIPKICFNSTVEELSLTKNLQVSIVTLSFAIYKLLSAKKFKPYSTAGFSLGEMTALAALEIVPFYTLLDLVKIRGEVMEIAALRNPGAMYSIIGKSDELISEICDKTKGMVIPANFNSPGQTVISGEEKAVTSAATALEKVGARVVKLNVSGGFHTNLMLSCVSPLKDYISDLEFIPPTSDLFLNLTGGKLTDTLNANDNFSQFMRDYIIKQMSSPVLFKNEIISMENHGTEIFVEAGIGRVLSGFVKRTAKNASFFNVEDCASLEKTLSVIFQ